MNWSPKLINRPDGRVDGEPVTLDSLWQKARSLGFIRVWTSEYTGSHQVKITFKIRNSTIEAESQAHGSIHDAFIEVIEEAWALGARP